MSSGDELTGACRSKMQKPFRWREWFGAGKRVDYDQCMGDDLTVEILKQIRDGVFATNARLDSMNDRIDQTNSRLDQTNSRLDQMIIRLDRVEQGVSDFGKIMRHIALDQAKHERFHSQHMNVLEQDVADLKERVRKLEDRTPSDPQSHA